MAKTATPNKPIPVTPLQSIAPRPNQKNSPPATAVNPATAKRHLQKQR